MTEDLLKKACEAKSPEELLRIAHENGMTDFNEENARVYFDALTRHGELSDEEINAAGGGCAVRSHGQKMVSYLNSCRHWRCNACNGNYGYDKTWDRTFQIPKPQYLEEEKLGVCNDSTHHRDCDDCYYVSYERGAWWCNNAVHYYE